MMMMMMMKPKVPNSFFPEIEKEKLEDPLREILSVNNYCKFIQFMSFMNHFYDRFMVLSLFFFFCKL